MNIQENVELKNLSTFKIGGKAQYVVYAEQVDDVVESLRFAQEKSLPIGIIGAGCNLLIHDDGIRGVIIKMNTKSMAVNGSQLQVDAGVSLAAMTAFGHKYNLVGLEWAPSVPSSVGGAIRGNAGAFGGETKDLLKQVIVYRDGNILDIDSSEIVFSYRQSTFKQQENTDIILGGVFELSEGDITVSQSQIKYNILTKNHNQPIGVACSGCIFKNYTGFIDESLYGRYPELQHFVSKGIIPTGYLIEKAGLKGYGIGDIQISEKHSNYMINKGKGTYGEVVELIDKVKNQIYDIFRVRIEEEVVYLHKQMKLR